MVSMFLLVKSKMSLSGVIKSIFVETTATMRPVTEISTRANARSIDRGRNAKEGRRES